VIGSPTKFDLSRGVNWQIAPAIPLSDVLCPFLNSRKPSNVGHCRVILPVKHRPDETFEIEVCMTQTITIQTFKKVFIFEISPAFTILSQVSPRLSRPWRFRMI
jgi:hypothetical protein